MCPVCKRPPPSPKSIPRAQVTPVILLFSVNFIIEPDAIPTTSLPSFGQHRRWHQHHQQYPIDTCLVPLLQLNLILNNIKSKFEDRIFMDQKPMLVCCCHSQMNKYQSTFQRTSVKLVVEL